MRARSDGCRECLAAVRRVHHTDAVIRLACHVKPTTVAAQSLHPQRRAGGPSRPAAARIVEAHVAAAIVRAVHESGRDSELLVRK